MALERDIAIIDIGGLAAGEFDAIQMTRGDFDVDDVGPTLGGALNIRLVDGFVPNLGDTFQIMTFQRYDGQFSAINGLDIGNGMQFQVNTNPTDITLEVIATP